ncbi:MAG: glycosyl hydrolase, partial [Verrucomicrobia bacterium]|nr:glycosyl hydrolase [Verrucomicrobiota bacterium]
SPQVFRPPASATRGNPPERLGYNFDGCAPETLVARMSVKDGRLVLPDGMSYRVLVLPEVPTMTPALLRKIRELVKAGATILGPPPVKSPSLSGYPQCDAEVKKLAAEMWGGGMGSDGRNGRKGGGSKLVIPQASTQIPVGSVIWDDALKTPGTSFADESPLSAARWIWYHEGNPAVSAPVGKRYFRQSFMLEGNISIESARVAMMADNSFEVWVNGQRAGKGDNFHLISAFDVRQMLRPGMNVIAVAAENGGDTPNPAGLIGAVVVKFKDGHVLVVPTTGSWQASQAHQNDWTTDTTAAGDWSAALELGPQGMAPWGAVGKSGVEPEVYCDFGVVTNLLGWLGVPPDFESDGPIRYTHRRTDEADVYFIANREDRAVDASCTFRVTGKAPELWDPLRGQTRVLHEFNSRDGRTTVPMRFEPAQSFFVVFRKPTSRTIGEEAVAMPPARSSTDGPFPLTPALCLGEREKGTPPLDPTEHAGSADTRQKVLPLPKGEGWGEGESHSRNFPQAKKVAELAGSWEVAFDPKWGGPERVTFASLEDWSKRPEDGIRFYSGTAIYRKTFDRPTVPHRQRMYLDLGVVKNLARVRLNGHDLGVVWCAPWRVDITDAVKAKDNQLEIAVANLWPNRLIGDQTLPPEKRLTSTTWNPFTKDSPLLESGLLGPVALLAEMTEPTAQSRRGEFSAKASSGTHYTIIQDATHRLVTMADGGSNLVLRLNYNDGCRLDQVAVIGRQLLGPDGVRGALRVSNEWFTSKSGAASPEVIVTGNKVTVRGNTFGGKGIQVKEDWEFAVAADRILWRINRNYGAGGSVEDSLFPGWDFQNMHTWTGGLLDNGGVAWNKYLETTNATYGTHANTVTLWNQAENDCLRIRLEDEATDLPLRRGGAMRFSHQPSGAQTVAFSVAESELRPRQDLRRFHPSQQQIWAPFNVKPGSIGVTYSLQAGEYDAAYPLETNRGLNGRSIRELLHTIGRYGVIDRRIVGANGWRTGYACLHEQWFSQMGIAIDDPDYLANCAATFDFELDHAI